MICMAGVPTANLLLHSFLGLCVMMNRDSLRYIIMCILVKCFLMVKGLVE